MRIVVLPAKVTSPPADGKFCLCTRSFIISLVYFDDGAVGILQEDLIPATHRPNAVVGELNIFLAQHRLERLDIVGTKRNVTAIDRVETLFGPECDAEI